MEGNGRTQITGRTKDENDGKKGNHTGGHAFRCES